MNLYDALNQGDGSLREPHFTSLLFYIFKVTKEQFPNKSFLDLFINQFIPEFPKSIECEFNIESDIKIEELLIHENLRRDTDIIIFLRQNEQLKILNIENKLSNLSYREEQIEEQYQIISSLYPDSEIKNILILPYYSDKLTILSENVQVIYWYSDSNSIIQTFNNYAQEIIDQNEVQGETPCFLNSIIGLFGKLSFIFEQEILSSETTTRGPRNPYRRKMFEYLTSIANEWENIFDESDKVTVEQLLSIFEEHVIADLRDDYPTIYQDYIESFKRGALLAQPKVATINERNRVHFGINNSNDKRLFYYPDSPNGSYDGQWKNQRIKPIRLMDENNDYLIYWREANSNDIKTDVYQC